MIEAFSFQQHEVRGMLDEHGEKWFVAADIAKALGYAATSTMTRRLDEDERGVQDLHTPSGTQQMTVITESGVWSAIIGSQLESAKAFKQWLTKVVLPALNKTGSYSMAETPIPDERTLVTGWLKQLDRADAAERRIAELEPAADAFNHMVDATGTFSVAAAGKILKGAPGISTGPRLLMGHLRKFGWIYKRDNLPKQAQQDNGRLTVKMSTYLKGQERVETLGYSTRITHKGMRELHRKLGGTTSFEGLLPATQLRLVGAAS